MFLVIASHELFKMKGNKMNLSTLLPTTDQALHVAIILSDLLLLPALLILVLPVLLPLLAYRKLTGQSLDL